MTINHKRQTDQLRQQMIEHQQRQRRHSDHHHGAVVADDDTFNEDADEVANDSDDQYLLDSEQLADVQITPDMFLDMCPLLLLQLDQRACTAGVSSSRVADIAAPSGWHGSIMCKLLNLERYFASQ